VGVMWVFWVSRAAQPSTAALARNVPRVSRARVTGESSAAGPAAPP